MTKWLFFLATFSSFYSIAQKFYFPKSYYSDSAALDKNMPVLAKQIIASYKESDKITYYDNLVRYRMVAKQYKESNKTLDSIRFLLSDKVVGIQFQAFSAAKQMQNEEQLSFKDAYRKTLSFLFNNLPKEEHANGASYFVADINELHERLIQLISKQTNSDSINLDDARMLCRTYNSYNVYSHIIPLSKPFFAEIDYKKYLIQDSVLIPMRDGTKLAAIIVRSKESSAPQPVIVKSDIYYEDYDLDLAKDIVQRGFTAVVLYTRGKYLSDAAIEPFEHDANDGYDAIDWISKQEWCNGKIGMYGGSYLGFSQWAAVKKIHPALKTIVPQVAVAPGIDYPMHNGVFMSYMLRWINYVANSKRTATFDFLNDKKWNGVYDEWYKSGKTFRSLDTIEGRPNSIFRRWLQHPLYDSFWIGMTPHRDEFEKINIPVLTITGYFDGDQRGAFNYYNQHHKYNTKANHYLLIGPWSHNGAQSHGYSLAGYTIDSVANISIDQIVFQWFNYILKDSSKPVILQDKINYQVMGTNDWKHVSVLNKKNTDTLSFYLSNVPALNRYYRLENKKPEANHSINQIVDFKDRSDSSKLKDLRNIDDYLILDSTIDTKNYLSYISSPLQTPVDITGSFAGDILLSINKRDVDFNVYLYELQRDGKYFQLSSYLTRASLAKDKSKRQLLQPFKKQSIPINNSFFVSKKLSKGSRIIVLLGVNKNRNWQINYGTGKDVNDETINDAKIPLQIKWYNTSVIKIPVQK